MRAIIDSLVHGISNRNTGPLTLVSFHEFGIKTWQVTDWPQLVAVTTDLLYELPRHFMKSQGYHEIRFDKFWGLVYYSRSRLLAKLLRLRGGL